MATGFEMMVHQLTRFIPKDVWQHVSATFDVIRGKAEGLDARLARIEATQAELKLILLALLNREKSDASETAAANGRFRLGNVAEGSALAGSESRDQANG